MDDTAGMPVLYDGPRRPISIRVENNSDFPRTVTLFDPAVPEKGITIESDIVGVNYKEILRWLAVSKNMLIEFCLCVGGQNIKPQQIEEFYAHLDAVLSAVDKNGQRYKLSLPFGRDPFQVEKAIAIQNLEATPFDKETRLSFVVPAKTRFFLDVYLERTTNITAFPAPADFRKEFGDALILKTLTLPPKTELDINLII
jgi:hypothetical protein